MSHDRKHRAVVWLTEEERAELEKLMPAYGYEDLESFLPKMIRYGIGEAIAEQRRAMREARKSTRRLKKNPAVNLDDDIPF